MLDSLMNTALTTLAAADPAQHVYNHPFIVTDDGMWLWSGNQGNLVLSGILIILLGLFVASKVQTGPETQGVNRYLTTNKFAAMIEVICVYLQEEVARPLLGDRTKKLMPYLWTIFFFILANNLLGLVPMMDAIHILAPDLKKNHSTFLGGTATQNIWVTGTLAIVAGIFFNFAAIKRLGIKGYFSHMTAGAPIFVAPLVFALELAGQILIKPVALALRLFANMTAGHILLATLLGFVAQGFAKGFAVGAVVSVISIGGAVAIMFLELFVAFLQAFIFMFLTAVFISLMDHHDDHGHEHAHGHGHEHAHA
jgi:F-type H+-transporting ATPase subunit a